VQCETEAAAQAGAPTSEEDPGGNDGSQPFTDFDPQELAGEELEEDPATEELSLAGMELDLSAAEVGRAGEGTGLGAEEFFFADEEPEGSADAVGPEPADRDAGARQVAEELEEIRYYLQQGLFDDAERLAHSLMAAHPEHPQLHAELDGIERARQAAAAADVQDDAFGDLMSGLQDEDLLDATGFLDSFADGSLVDDDLSQKLVSELDSADTESHYNLGIAYKEMGLYGEAIAEFDKAAQDPARRLDCITLTGQCHLEAGDKEAALAVFRSGLADPGLSDVGRMTLNFELGMLHRQHGELLEALEYFQLVAEKDTFFREVSELIRALRKELGLDDSDDGGPQGNRDRVSYV
jgi:tetratricopeptide (TPR) repeat protein